MRFTQIAFGTVLFAEACLLLYSPQQRFIFHSFIDQIKRFMACCFNLQSASYQSIENIRYFLIALIVSGSFSLFIGTNLIVGIFAQFLWTITQSQLYHNQGLKEIRNTLIQVLFVLVLLEDYRNIQKIQHKKKMNQMLTYEKEIKKMKSVTKMTQGDKQSKQKSLKQQQKHQKKHEKYTSKKSQKSE